MNPMKHLKAVIFDWAGTVVDHGSLAPMGAFVETFAEFGLAVMESGELSITQSEVEGFMLDSNGDWIAR